MSRLGNPDPSGGSGVGGRGAYDVSEVSCLDSAGFLYSHLVLSPDAGSPKKGVASGRWPQQLRQTLKELGLGAGGLADQLPHSWAASPSWKRGLGSTSLYAPHPAPR